jgi:hypothetical protein
MNIAFSRPSPQRLERLLLDNPEKFERYLTRFPELADHFEATNPLKGLSAKGREAFDVALDSALAVPNDLALRLRQQITSAQRETSSLAVLLDVAGVGVSTLSNLINDEPID